MDLAVQAGVTRQAMNYVLGQLEQLGYLERRIDPDDVRSRRIYLTQRGAATIPIIRNAIAELEREWETRLAPTDWHELKRLLIKLNAALA